MTRSRDTKNPTHKNYEHSGNHVFVSDTIIYSPKVNTIYHLENHSTIENEKMTVTFSGDILNDVNYIDVSSTIFVRQLKSASDVQNLNPVSFPFVTMSSLELPEALELNSPLFVWSKDHFYTVSNIHFYLNTVDPDINITGHESSAQPPTHNEMIERQFQKEIQGIPKNKIGVSKYPICLTNQKPTLSYLQKLFFDFMSYNQERLELQNTYSKNLCHVRAHFVNMLLGQYKIQSLKIVKFWNLEDWKTYSPQQPYVFHSAALIIDQNDLKWVWDPWEGSRQRLMTLNEWINFSKMPPPNRVLIASSAQLYTDNPIKIGSTQLRKLPLREFPIMQSLFNSAVPNPPERPLQNKYCGKSDIEKFGIGTIKAGLFNASPVINTIRFSKSVEIERRIENNELSTNSKNSNMKKNPHTL